MFTKQYEQALLAQLSNGKFTITKIDGTVSTYTSTGTSVSLMIIPAICKQYSESMSQSSSAYGVIFGNGTVAPTREDTTLSGDVVTGLTCTVKQTFSKEVGKTVLTNVYTILNGNDEAVTISEIALKGRWDYSSAGPIFMVDRTLLEEPITIEPNAVGQVTYTITMDYSA